MKDARIEKLVNSSIDEQQIQDLRALLNLSPVERNALLAKQAANIAEYFVPGSDEMEWAEEYVENNNTTTDDE